MNKHFNINDADHEGDWKDLTIMRLLAEISDLEDIIDNVRCFIEDRIKELKEDHLYIELHKKDIYKILDILDGDVKDEKE